MERQEIEQRLSTWLQRYVLADWTQASEAQRMKRPLAEATLKVLEATRRTTERYPIILSIRPHFGLRTPQPSSSTRQDFGANRSRRELRRKS